MDEFKEKSEAEYWYNNNISDEDYLFFANLNLNIYNKKFDSGDTIKTLQENYDNKIKNLDQKYQKEKSEQKNDFENILRQKDAQNQSLNKKLDELNETKRNEVNKAEEQEKLRGRIEFQKEMKKKDEELSTKAEEIKKLTLEKDKAVDKEVRLKVGELKLEHSQNMKEVEEQLQNALKNNEINTAIIAELKEEKSTFQDEVKEYLQRKEKPIDIGEDGELFVQELLKDHFIRSERVSKKKHKADFSIRFPKSSICAMIDVKNYANDGQIPADERKKFIEDLDKNLEYNCGILLSLNGGFPNTCVELKVYQTDSGKPYCFLGNLATRLIPDVVLKSCLLSLFYTTEKSTTQNLSHNGLIKIIQDSINFLSDGVKNADDLTKQALKFYSKAKNNYEELHKKAEEIKSNFEKIKHEGPNNDVEMNGDDHQENASPAKVPRTG